MSQDNNDFSSCFYSEKVQTISLIVHLFQKKKNIFCCYLRRIYVFFFFFSRLSILHTQTHNCQCSMFNINLSPSGVRSNFWYILPLLYCEIYFNFNILTKHFSSSLTRMKWMFAFVNEKKRNKRKEENLRVREKVVVVSNSSIALVYEFTHFELKTTEKSNKK